ncbi:hypothetical protein ACFXKD_27445 [Nocardiopsis aegyptia]
MPADEAERAISALKKRVEAERGPAPVKDEDGNVNPSALADRIRKAMGY